MNISRTLNQLKVVVLAIFAGAILAGCTGVGGPNSEQIAKDRLELARTAYSQAKVDPEVESYALKSFLEAEKTLQEAETVNKKAYSISPTDTTIDKKPLFDDVSRLAYMAEMKAKSSVALAEGVVAQNEVVKLGKEKAEVQLLKSQMEKNRLRQDLEAKAAALENAKQQLSMATSDAERARILADIRAKEAALAKAQADAKALEAERLMKDLSELQGQLTDRGIVLTIGDVLFATGKSELNISAEISMDKIAAFLQENQNRNLLVEGHTDSVGSDAYNQGLSEQRAAAVKSALVKRGVASERIVTIGYGKKFPLASNETAAGKQQNRRVEAIILNEGVLPESQFRK